VKLDWVGTDNATAGSWRIIKHQVHIAAELTRSGVGGRRSSLGSVRGGYTPSRDREGVTALGSCGEKIVDQASTGRTSHSASRGAWTQRSERAIGARVRIVVTDLRSANGLPVLVL